MKPPFSRRGMTSTPLAFFTWSRNQSIAGSDVKSTNAERASETSSSRSLTLAAPTEASMQTAANVERNSVRLVIIAEPSDSRLRERRAKPQRAYPLDRIGVLRALVHTVSFDAGEAQNHPAGIMGGYLHVRGG